MMQLMSEGNKTSGMLQAYHMPCYHNIPTVHTMYCVLLLYELMGVLEQQRLPFILAYCLSVCLLQEKKKAQQYQVYIYIPVHTNA